MRRFLVLGLCLCFAVSEAPGQEAKMVIPGACLDLAKPPEMVLQQRSSELPLPGGAAVIARVPYGSHEILLMYTGDPKLVFIMGVFMKLETRADIERFFYRRVKDCPKTRSAILEALRRRFPQRHVEWWPY